MCGSNFNETDVTYKINKGLLNIQGKITIIFLKRTCHFDENSFPDELTTYEYSKD